MNFSATSTKEDSFSLVAEQESMIQMRSREAKCSLGGGEAGPEPRPLRERWALYPDCIPWSARSLSPGVEGWMALPLPHGDQTFLNLLKRF